LLRIADRMESGDEEHLLAEHEWAGRGRRGDLLQVLCGELMRSTAPGTP